MKNIAFLTFLLLLPSGAALLLNWIRKKEVVPGRFAARLGLALVMFTTGLAHFIQTDEMTMLLPPWVLGARVLILITGVLEIAAAVGLLIERTSKFTADCLIAFFVAVFPANVWAAVNRIDYGGHSLGPAYLLVRGPLQALLIIWALKISVRK